MRTIDHSEIAIQDADSSATTLTAVSSISPGALACISVALGGIGQLVVKASLLLSSRGTGVALQGVLLKSIAGILLGLAIYASGTWFWFCAVKRASISYLYPISASSYILVAMGGRFLFGEGIHPIRWAGIAVITLGVAMLPLTGSRGA
jgi:drug/metabolite transporter (DMT)-like permease